MYARMFAHMYIHTHVKTDRYAGAAKVVLTDTVTDSGKVHPCFLLN